MRLNPKVLDDRKILDTDADAFEKRMEIFFKINKYISFRVLQLDKSTVLVQPVFIKLGICLKGLEINENI